MTITVTISFTSYFANFNICDKWTFATDILCTFFKNIFLKFLVHGLLIVFFTKNRFFLLENKKIGKYEGLNKEKKFMIKLKRCLIYFVMF